MVTYKLATSATTGTLGDQKIVNSLQIVRIRIDLHPALAPLGAGEIWVTLADPESRVHEVISYKDISVQAFWASAQAAAGSLGDAIAQAIFTKLAADKKLPAGTVIVSQ